MDFLVYGMEISLVQPNVSLIKLTFSSRGIVLVLLENTKAGFWFSADGQQHAFGQYKLRNFWRTFIEYIQATIFRQRDFKAFTYLFLRSIIVISLTAAVR